MRPDIKILIASGYSANGQARGALESGAAGFLSKPFKFKDMLKAIRDILGGAHAR